MTNTELRAEPGRVGADWAWLADDLPPLLRLATVLTGDPARAGSLVAPALARERAGREDFPQTRLRQLVVRCYLTSGDGSTRSRLAHACVVLRHFEGLTMAEIATVVDRPIGQVTADLSTDELHPQDLRAALARLADTAPEPAVALAELDRTSRSLGSRRRRRARLIILAAAVAALLILLPTVVLPRPPAETRTAGDWSLIHQVKPPRGWSVLDHGISPTVESTTLGPDEGSAQAGGACQIKVYIPGGLDLALLPQQRDPVRVRGRQAFFSQGDGLDFSPFLAFRYATDAWTIVQCPRDDQLDRTKLMLLASAVTFRKNPIALPFKLTALPSGYRVESATQGVAPASGELILAMTQIRVGDDNIAISYTPLDTPTDNGFTRIVRINGRPAFLDYASSHPRLCISAESSYVCLAAYWPLGDWPAPAPLPVDMGQVLMATAQQLQLASDLADVDTWYSGQDALPAG